MASYQTKIQVLRDARKLIASREEEFVCCAINTCDTWHKPYDYRMACFVLKREIDDNMARVNCAGSGVDRWLSIVVPGLTMQDLSVKILRDYRLAWLDNWIRELKAEGRRTESQMTPKEKFKGRLKKAGWFTYKDEESGRVVTNCYRHELGVVEKITGVKCEFVGETDDFVGRVSYVEES